jgi:hypothetical protein
MTQGERTGDNGRRCPHCAYLVSPRTSVCARCGHDLPPLGRSGWPLGLIAAVAVAGLFLAYRRRN